MAKLKLERLRPTRATFATVFGLLWAVSFGALRDFVWVDIRAGLIDLRGLSRATRTLIWFGLALLALMVAALLFNDALRAQSNLIAKTVSVSGRGALLPEVLLPLTLFMLSIAWGFLLTGALHSRPLIRIALLLVYLVLSGWRVLNMATGSALSGEVFNTNLWLSFGAWLAVPLFFVLRRRAQAHPIVEFTVLFTLIAVNFAVSQSDGVGTWRDYGIPLTLAELEASIQLPGIFILPLLLFFGIDVANFARRAAGWTVDIVTQRMARWALWVILIAVCAWRLWTVITETTARLAQDNLTTTLSLYASALVVPLLVAAVWVPVGEGWPWRRSRAGIPQPDAVSEIAEKVALPLITLYMIATIVASWTIPSQVFDAGGLVVSLGALAATFWLSRRGRHSTAVFLGTFSTQSIWRELTKPGAPLSALDIGSGSSAQLLVDFWWVLALLAIALLWLARHELTAERAARLLLLLLITEMIRQTSFIESPFSPFLGFAGIGFVAFGIVWDVVTKGFWTNRSTPALPRVSRLFLYLGYVLFTVTLINWTLTSHDLERLGMFTGNLADVGFGRFGKPLLYAVLAATLALPPSTDTEHSE